MSLLPYFFDEVGFRRPLRIIDQHFSIPITPEDYRNMVVDSTMFGEYYRPWRHLAAEVRDVGSNIRSDKDKFQIILDVQQFMPGEISVKTANGYIVVEGKHEEKKDGHGYISRQFMRRYPLPAGTEIEKVESQLSSDGILSITAPKTVPDTKKVVRIVPIKQTGSVHKETDSQSIKPQENKQNNTELRTNGERKKYSELRKLLGHTN